MSLSTPSLGVLWFAFKNTQRQTEFLILTINGAAQKERSSKMAPSQSVVQNRGIWCLWTSSNTHTQSKWLKELDIPELLIAAVCLCTTDVPVMCYLNLLPAPFYQMAGLAKQDTDTGHWSTNRSTTTAILLHCNGCRCSFRWLIVHFHWADFSVFVYWQFYWTWTVGSVSSDWLLNEHNVFLMRSYVWCTFFLFYFTVLHCQLKILLPTWNTFSCSICLHHLLHIEA